MLHEDMERQVVRRIVRQAQKEQPPSKGKHREQGRDMQLKKFFIFEAFPNCFPIPI